MTTVIWWSYCDHTLVTNSQSLCGLFGLNHHTLEKMCDVTAVTDGLTNRGGNWKIEQYSGRPETAGKQQTCSSPQTKISECLLLHCLAISPSASICQQSVRERIFIDPHCRSHTYLWCSCIGERRFNDPHIFSACHLFWREMDVDKSRRVSFNLWEQKLRNIFCRCRWGKKLCRHQPFWVFEPIPDL